MAEIAIAAAISAAVAATAYTANYALTPKPQPIQKGRLSGGIQIQDSRYGHMIPILLGGNPVLAAGEAPAFVGERRNYDFQAGGGGNPDIGQINPPAGVQDGDYLLAHTLTDDGSSFPPATPDGWLKLQEQVLPYESGTAVFTLFGKF